MKIKKGFLLRSVGEQNIVFAAGKAAKEFNGIIRLNETGRFLWEKLKTDTTKEALVEALTREYEVGDEDAARDVNAFVAELSGAGLLD
ncbi:MAG: PqqD family protein [Bacteroides sp.]|nr:PqqD family protein [Eubacterium sp.]MCM1418084.1 PqqD family protein [Roseburia sp.]MCM1462228.1 PqqD family protein [Bacteroides sp.]